MNEEENPFLKMKNDKIIELLNKTSEAVMTLDKTSGVELWQGPTITAEYKEQHYPKSEFWFDFNPVIENNAKPIPKGVPNFIPPFDSFLAYLEWKAK